MLPPREQKESSGKLQVEIEPPFVRPLTSSKITRKITRRRDRESKEDMENNQDKESKKKVSKTPRKRETFTEVTHTQEGRPEKNQQRKVDENAPFPYLKRKSQPPTLSSINTFKSSKVASKLGFGSSSARNVSETIAPESMKLVNDSKSDTSSSGMAAPRSKIPKPRKVVSGKVVSGKPLSSGHYTDQHPVIGTLWEMRGELMRSARERSLGVP